MNNNEPIKLTAKEAEALQLIEENAAITRKEMVSRMQCSESTVKRAIDGLITKNVIRRIGARKNGTWEILSNT